MDRWGLVATGAFPPCLPRASVGTAAEDSRIFSGSFFHPKAAAFLALLCAASGVTAVAGCFPRVLFSGVSG